MYAYRRFFTSLRWSQWPYIDSVSKWYPVENSRVHCTVNSSVTLVGLCPSLYKSLAIAWFYFCLTTDADPTDAGCFHYDPKVLVGTTTAKLTIFIRLASDFMSSLSYYYHPRSLIDRLGRLSLFGTFDRPLRFADLTIFLTKKDMRPCMFHSYRYEYLRHGLATFFSE